MIFADKLIRLRKKNGWSQEELADKMRVSRQAVSKWEGAQTVPDLQKVLQLSALFGVTTDYLLKDELETEVFTDSDAEPGAVRVTMDEANAYLAQRRQAARQIALGTFLCVLSPIPLLLLGAATECGLSENVAGGVGIVLLLVVVGVAVAIFTSCGFCASAYEYLEKVPFETEYGVKGLVRQRQQDYRPAYARCNVAATCICVVSPVPLLIGAFTENDLFVVIMLCVTMLLAGVGAALFILAGVPWAAMQRLLQEGEYTPAARATERIRGPIATIYWTTATALYLGYSFWTGNWAISWIIWPVAGVLYGAVYAVCSLVLGWQRQ